VGPSVVRTGRFGENTVRLLSIAQADAAMKDRFSRLVHWASKFGLSGLTGGWIGQNELALTYADPGTTTKLPIASAGGGSQKILPFIVDAFANPTPSTILVDEIEESAHPEWQLNLADLLADVVTHGHQVIATTHSPTMVLAVCSAVQSGQIAHDKV